MTEPGPAPQAPDAARLADPFRAATFEKLFERRIVFLRGAIDGEKADELAAQLLALDGESSAPVTLVIDSPGGDTFGMFALHDTMQLMGAPGAHPLHGHRGIRRGVPAGHRHGGAQSHAERADH